MARKSKDYAVEIYSRYSSGRYGKDHYCGWVLNDISIDNVKSFALEIIAGMTYREFTEQAMTTLCMPFGVSEDDKIGYEKAEELFTIKASVFKG